ncbi:MAG: glycoside hydrolase family 18 protein [bacterium]|nr:glycoside hydrolase family 18 protein [bacterium]
MRSLLSKFLLLCCPLAAAAHSVVGYYPSWAIYARNYLVTDIPADRLTHINYAFANIANGEVVLGDTYADTEFSYPGDTWNEFPRGNFKQLNRLKSMYPQLKTLISVGGWTWSANFSDAAATPEARETFANSCASFVALWGFDGVDLDWEYPVFGGNWDVEHRPEDGANFTLLCNRIRVKLDSLALINGRPYLLTLAVSASGAHIDDLELPQLAEVVDFFNVMTYDFQGAWSAYTGFNAPLHADPADPFSEPEHTTFNLHAAMQNYVTDGVPREKLHAGLAFYGKGFGNVADANNGLYQTFSGPSPNGTWEPGVFDYSHLAESFVNQNGYTRYFHPLTRVPYLHNPTANIFISYDDTVSIAEKCDYIIAEEFGGAMFWELSCDRNSVLLNKVYQTFANAPDIAAPQALTAITNGDSLYFRWLSVPGATQYTLWSSADALAPPQNYTLELTTANTQAALPVPGDGMKLFFVRAE